MTYPRRPDSLNDNRDHRADASRDDNRTVYHAALGGYDDEPEAREVADLEADGW